MNIFDLIIKKVIFFEKEPQKIGLSQFKTKMKNTEPDGPSLKKKDVKLSDLMRRAS